jgi:hypothetical protein
MMYRFRPIFNLLDGYHELDKQEIFFAAPHQLNDPMEGFRDIFWQGDYIVWENLLKNYVDCVAHIYILTLAGVKNLTIDNIPLHPYPNLKATPEQLALGYKIREKFFSHTFIQSLPRSLERRKQPVRRGELLSYLSYVHHYAIDAAEGQVVPAVFNFDLAGMNEMLSKTGDLADLANRFEEENMDGPERVESFFLITNLIKQSYALEASANFLLNDLPELFVNKLETLLYPNWYSASFLSECTNSAVWGYYGDGHKGACLMYEGKEKDKLQIGGMYPQTFRKMRYHNKHESIDYFRSIGRPPQAYLESNWYTDSKGNISACADHLYTDFEKWRKAHWKSFYDSLTIKLKEWRYEKEYRLIIEELVGDFSKDESRSLKYQFEELKGIIFGIKTTPQDKQKIISIIKNKCAQADRKDFEFYQAFYDKKSGLIDKLKLNIV